MKTAVVLFNLGGPDSPEAVQPFLQNLFSDPAIIASPGPVRWLLARLISRRRAPVAREIYRQIGGRSPLLPETEAQAGALQEALQDIGEVRCFIAMRYWYPFVEQTARDVAGWRPDRVVLLPLYPQFSTTTTGSSLTAWRTAAKAAGLEADEHVLCCYPADRGLIEAHVARILPRLEGLASFRLLFSAHGLPQRVVDGGDPYQWQVEQTADAIVEALKRNGQAVEDWLICYQSRVGPLKWIGPSTEEEIERAGRDGRPVVVVPIAFVSEHSETLVELDIEYAELAASAGVEVYRRVPTVGAEPVFIEGLADLVRRALVHNGDAPACDGGGRLCPATWSRCPATVAA